ncbi:uncharacterized protein [Nicotiana sylvestris]|uniref:uncharacterized protein n=1 Tax=Nicotiana sylvestris TaxID=4096 RepID=UPI00388C82D0
MTGLSTSTIAHKLPINPMWPPVKQKLRKFKPDMSLKIKEEVTKQIKAMVLRVVEYPTWLANIVPVPKKDGKVRKPMPIGKLAKWQILLSEFDIVYVTQKAVKGQALEDHLAENPVDGEYEPLKTYFPNEDASFVGEILPRRTMVGGCSLTEQQTSKEWVLGEWATKNTKILPYLHCVQEMIKRFTKIKFKHVPRIQNEFADTLSTLFSMIQHPDKNFIAHILIGIHKQPAYCAHVEEEIDENMWFHDIKEYLEKGEYLEHATHT